MFTKECFMKLQLKYAAVSSKERYAAGNNLFSQGVHESSFHCLKTNLRCVEVQEAR